tara:strand:- start:1253 stop:1534 length:282 start_codon:yes stop_codon:yes gene_type:complete
MADPTLPPTKFPEGYRQALEEILKTPAYMAAVQYLKENNEAKESSDPTPQDRLVQGALANAKQVGFLSSFRLMKNLAKPQSERPDLPGAWKGQ